MKHSLYCLLMVGFLSLSGCSDTPEEKSADAQRHLSTAKAYQAQGQYRAALIEARNAASKSQQPQEALEVLASIYNQIGAHGAAIALLEKHAQQQYPLQLLLAEAYLGQQKYQSAIKLLSGLTADQNPQKYFELLSLAALAGQDKELADSSINRLVTLLGDSPLKYYWQAQQAAYNQEFAEAQKHLQTLVEKEPNNSKAWILKGNVALVSGALADAENYFSKALTLQTNSDILTAEKILVLTQLTEVLNRLGRMSEAYRYQKLLADANPESSAAQQKYNQALTLFQKGQLQEAETLLAELRAQFPQDKNTATLLGLVEFQQGDAQQAAQLFDQVIDPETATASVLQAAALAKLRSQQMDDALALLQSAAEKQPKNPEVLTTYAMALLDKSPNDNQAIALLEKSLALNPQQIRVYLVLARHQLRQKNSAKALAYLQTAFKQQPGDLLVQQALFGLFWQEKQLEPLASAQAQLPKDNPARQLFWQGWLALQQNNYPAAAEAFNRALAQNPNPEAYLAQVGLAQTLERQQQGDAALTAWQRALDANPQLIPAYARYLSLAKQLNRTDAVAPYLRALSEKTPAWQPQAVLAEWLGTQARWDDAVAAAQIAYDKSQQTPSLKPLLARLYWQKAQSLRSSDAEQSRQWLSKGLQLQPENADLFGGLLELQLAAKNFTQAQQLVDEYAKTAAPPAAVLYMRGLLAEAQEKPSDALSLYRESFRSQANDKAADGQLRILQKTQQREAAKAFLEQWIAQQPRNPKPRLYLAMAAQQAGDKAQAQKAYEDLLSQQAESVVALNNLAWLYHESGNPQALALAQKAYALAPQSAQVLDTYGWLLVHSGDKTQGIALLEKALQLAQDQEDIKRHLQEAKSVQK
jgi:cellulose synthase operon protein C